MGSIYTPNFLHSIIVISRKLYRLEKNCISYRYRNHLSPNPGAYLGGDTIYQFILILTRGAPDPLLGIRTLPTPEYSEIFEGLRFFQKYQKCNKWQGFNESSPLQMYPFLYYYDGKF